MVSPASGPLLSVSVSAPAVLVSLIAGWIGMLVNTHRTSAPAGAAGMVTVAVFPDPLDSTAPEASTHVHVVM